MSDDLANIVRRFRSIFMGRRRMRWALLTIGTTCEKLHQGMTSQTCWDVPNWTPDCPYTADRWCDPCIARRGLT